MIFRLLLLTLLLFQVQAQESISYIWPTNASKYLTSSFCEYRPGHYHSAIDIKTWNKEGYPIYAISDALIYKIRVSPFGYGKVIYLLLDDGNYAVYAHLQKFNPELEQKIKYIQLANKRYTLNWMPDRIRVKQGDLLGFTGQTGIGSPHLHFEIRDPQERPMNPLLFYGPIKDTRAPVLKSLLVIPMKPESRINGSAIEQAFPLTLTKDKIYKIQQSIKIRGPVGLAVTGYDQADGVNNKFAFYKKILKTNNKKIFHQQYDIFDFAISKQVDIEIYYPQKAKNNIVYHKLFIEPFNQLPFYDRNLGNGIINIKSDMDIQIEVSDFNGNISKINFTFEKEMNDPFKLQVINRMDQFLYIHLQTPYNLEKLEFFSRINSNNWSPINQYEIIERALEKNFQQFLIRLRLPDTLHQQIKANVISDKMETILYGTNKEINHLECINLNISNLGESLLLDFNPIKSQAGFNLSIENDQFKDTIRPEVINDHFQYVVNSRLFNFSPLKIKFYSHKTVYIDTTIMLQKIIPATYQRFSFFNDSLQIISRPQSVYDTLLFDIQKNISNEFVYDVIQLSPIYNFNSAYQALNYGVDMTVKIDTIRLHPQQIGLYTINRKNRLELLKSQFDTSNHQVAGKLTSLGLYFVAADTMKPELVVFDLKDGQTFKTLNKVHFMAKDDQSGIQTDSNINITVDSQFVLPEWDPERDIITGYLDWPLKKGEHDIVIEVKDMADNRRIQKYTIIIE